MNESSSGLLSMSRRRLGFFCGEAEPCLLDEAHGSGVQPSGKSRIAIGPSSSGVEWEMLCNASDSIRMTIFFFLVPVPDDLRDFCERRESLDFSEGAMLCWALVVCV